MINIFEVNETNAMIEKENLDVRTITMGISLIDCMTDDLGKLKENIFRALPTGGDPPLQKNRHLSIVMHN